MDFDENSFEESFEEQSEETELFEIDDIFEEAMENYKIVKDSWRNVFEESIADRRFGLYGEQWDIATIQQRKQENRTTLVFNKCIQNIRYVVNSSIKETPAIKVTSKNNNKKKEAEIIAGIVRNIENESNAKDIYASTFQDTVAGSYGVFEICVDDVYEEGEEKIQIKRVLEPTTVYPDHLAIRPDFSDMRFLIREKSMSRKEFEKKYPKFESSTRNKETKDWFKDDMISVIEYWKKKNGNVEWYLLNGNEVIDSSILQGDYPGKFIPYVFILGEESFVDGERQIKSIIRDIKDYQRTLNYMQSETVDFVSKNAKAPYIASDAAIGEYKDLWKNANTKNYPYLPYHDGKTPPQRLDPPPAPIGFIDSIQRLDMDIRSATGIKDPLLDIPASQSGKAIKLQLAQQNLGTYVWVDHLNRAVKHCGKIIVDLIPHFYNFPHTQQTIGLDGQIKSIDIMSPDENGKIVDLTGDYSVTISVGSNYEDQRTETREMLMELAKVNPQIGMLGSDIIVRSMDFKESDEMADRMFAMLPPQIQNLKKDENDEDSKMTMIQMQMKMEEMGNVLKQTTQNLQKAIQENQMLQENFQQKSQSEMQKINLQNIGKIQTEEMNNESEEKQLQMKNENEYKMMEMKLQYDLKMKELEYEIEKVKSLQHFSNQSPTTFQDPLQNFI